MTEPKLEVPCKLDVSSSLVKEAVDHSHHQLRILVGIHFEGGGRGGGVARDVVQDWPGSQTC